MIDGSGVRAGVYVSQQYQAINVDLDSNFFFYFSRRRRSNVGVLAIDPATGKHERIGVVPEMRGPPAKVHFDSLPRVSHERNRSRWYRFLSLSHIES